MTTTQQIIDIGIMGIAVASTRFLPFLLFPSEKHTPRFVRFLSRYLAAAVFGMLVVYCLKNVDFLHRSHGVPQLLGVGSCVLLHLWRKNLLVTIAGGTVVYMLLVQHPSILASLYG